MAPLHIGHRGAAGHAPGNTILSIEAALRIGVDLVEIDVQQTSDGGIIVLHDRVLHPSTTGRGPVAAKSLDEIRLLRTIPGGLPIPTLEEVLACVSGRAGLMIEIKVPGIAAQTLSAVRNARFAGAVYYATFIHEELLVVRELDANASTIALLEGTPVNRTAFALDAKVTHAGLSIHSLSRSFVEQLHKAGIEVFVWTVDEPEQIEFAKDCGVDGIISNYPDRL